MGNESKHTPGPWRAVVRSNQMGVRSAGVDMPAGSRAWTRRGTNPKFDEQDAANARLIAAAPDLLATLKALRDECSGTPRTWVLVDLLTNATEAIAKAEGLLSSPEAGLRGDTGK